MQYKDLDKFTQGYVDCALWSSTDDNGEPLDKDHSFDDLAEETITQAQADCRQFQADNEADLSLVGRRGPDWTEAEGHGHDFWLTRNGHGVGFWDRGYGEVGTRLTDAAHAWGSCGLYIGDDGKIYMS